MRTRKRYRQMRNQRGIMGAMLFLGAILMVFTICTLGVDVSQITYTRQLLRACADSAAIAGAQDLYTNPDLCEQHALDIAEQYLRNNFQIPEGVKVADVTATVVRPTNTTPGKVTVEIDMTCNHHIGSIIFRPQDAVHVKAAAQGGGTLIRHSGIKLFPLAVSINQVPDDKKTGKKKTTYNDQIPLKDVKVGELAYFHINSQGFKNSAWTAFTLDNTNANWLDHAVDQCLGLETPVAGHIPSVQIGDQISLSNGVKGMKDLAKGERFEALSAEPLLFFPVIKDDPAYNQTRELIGFVGCKVEDVIIKGDTVETFVCRIVKAIDTNPGAVTGEIPSCGDPECDLAIHEWAPGNLKLSE